MIARRNLIKALVLGAAGTIAAATVWAQGTAGQKKKPKPPPPPKKKTERKRAKKHKKDED